MTLNTSEATDKLSRVHISILSNFCESICVNCF